MRFKGWFGRKQIGYGIGPRSWQGWLATTVVAAIVVGTRFVRPEAYGLPHWSRAVLLVTVMLAYFALAWATYDPEA